MSSKCQFWMSNNTSKDKFRFPVLPDKITITHDSQNESVTVSGLGEVTFIQDPTAKTFEWSCWFPAVPHQGSLKKKLRSPQEYVNKIEEWIASKKPVKFTVTDPKISLYCSIEAWNYYEQGGDPGTYYYTIKLKQYVEPIIRKLDTTPTIKKATIGGGGGGGGGTKTGKVKTSGSRLKMYKKKSSSSKVLKKIKNGSTVTVNSQSGSWSNITYGGKTGYAKSKYIKT